MLLNKTKFVQDEKSLKKSIKPCSSIGSQMGRIVNLIGGNLLGGEIGEENLKINISQCCAK